MLKEKIQSDFVEAMKARDEMRVKTLRLIKAAILKFETSGSPDELSDAKILELIQKEVKQRKDSISQFESGGRNDLVQIEKDELKILQSYLPEEMSAADVENAIKQILAELGEVNQSDFGKIMGLAMAKLKGRADGAVVREVIQKLL